MVKKKYLTIPQLAKLMGITREAVYKKVKKGQIPATKVGRIYIISEPDVQQVLNRRMSETDKSRIKKAVTKTIQEYGEVLKWLSKE